MKCGLLKALTLFLALLCHPATAEPQNAPVTAQTIDHFLRADPNQTRFGQLTFVGGLVLRSSNQHFGALSGLRLTTPSTLTAIADTGFWFTANLERDPNGVPVRFVGGKLAAVLDSSGRPFHQKWSSDLEGLTFDGKAAYISTEMDMRVLRFDPQGELLSTPSTRITEKFSDPAINPSFAFEAIATLPKTHPQHPGQLIIAELDSSGSGNVPAFILKEGRRFPLSVKQPDGMFITDADFLQNGDLLILERKFSLAKGALMRLRRIPGSSIKTGAKMDSAIVLEANQNHVIDNMEALSVFTGPYGKTRIAMMSDNNHWLMQRTLYLEFILVEEQSTGGQ